MGTFFKGYRRCVARVIPPLLQECPHDTKKWMKMFLRIKVFFVNIVLFVFIVASMLGCTSKDVNDVVVEKDNVTLPALLISETNEDGKQSKNITSTFKLWNSRDKSIPIDYLGADCGCIKVKHNEKELVRGDKIVLSPKEKADITMSFNVSSARTRNHCAKFKYRNRKDDGDAVVTLGITVTVYSDISLNSIMQQCFIEKPNQKVAELVIPFECRFRSKERQFLQPQFKSFAKEVALEGVFREGSLQKMEDDLWKQSGLLIVNANLTTHDISKPQRAQIFFKSKDKDNEKKLAELEFSILFHKYYGISAPSNLYFNCIGTTSSVSHDFILESRNEPFSVTGIKINSKNYKIFQKTNGPGKKQSFEVSYTPTDIGKHTETLEILTDHPEAPTVSIILNGKAKKPNG